MITAVITELRLNVRHGSVAAVGAVSAMWVVALLFAPVGWRPEIGAWALFFDLAGIGLFFVPALTVLERSNGVTQARMLAPIDPGRFLAVRVAWVAVLSVLASLVVLLAARAEDLPMRVGGVLGISVLLSCASIVALGAASGLPEYLGRMPFLAIPFLVPPLLDASGLVESAWLGLSPVTSGMRLVRGTGAWPDSIWLASWCVTAAVLAARCWRSAGSMIGEEANIGASDHHVRLQAGRSPWRSMAVVDRRTLSGDRMLLLVLSGIPLLALAVRWLGGGGAVWLEARWGFDIRPDLPAAWAFVLVAHTPLMIGAVCGLLFLEDRDLGVLPAVKSTGWSLPGLLMWRLGVTVVVSAMAVLIGIPLAGASHEAGAPGLVATAAAGGVLAALVAMLMASIGKDRVQGMAVMKVMGLPFYAPIALWFIGGPWALALMVVPSAWVMRAFWATSIVEAWAWALGGVVWSLALSAALARRFFRSVG